MYLLDRLHSWRKAPKLVWKRKKIPGLDGVHGNRLELWKRRDGSRFWKIYRQFEFTCPACGTPHELNWSCVVEFTAGVNPITHNARSVDSAPCKTCKQELGTLKFNVDLSEWFYSPGNMNESE